MSANVSFPHLIYTMVSFTTWPLMGFLLAISELRWELGRVSNLNYSINRHHHINGHVEIDYLTKFGALKLNRNHVMTLETWLKIHTNLYNFVTASPETI